MFDGDQALLTCVTQYICKWLGIKFKMIGPYNHVH